MRVRFFSAFFFFALINSIQFQLHAHVSSPEELAEAEERLEQLTDPQAKFDSLMEMVDFHLIDRDYEAIIELIGRAERLLPSLDYTDAARAKISLARAQLLAAQGRNLEALAEAERARIISSRVDDPRLKANVLRTLGNVFVLLRDYAKALDLFEESLGYAGQLDDQRLVSRTLNSIAIVHWRMKQWNETEDYLIRARQLHPDDANMRFFFDNNIGVALMEQGRYDEAEKLLLSALEFNKAQNNVYTYGLNQSNLGDLYQRMGEPEKALVYLNEVLNLEETPESRYILTRSFRHAARAMANLGRFPEAVAYGNNSLSLARTMDDPAEEMDSWNALIDIYSDSGEFQNALEASKHMHALSEELLSEQVRVRSALFRVRFDLAENEARVALMEREQRIRLLQRNSILIGLLLSLAIATILSLRYRFQRKANRQITSQKEEIERSHKDLEAVNNRLAHLNKEKDEILGIAAHDLRSPIGSIRHLARIMREDTTMKAAEKAELLEAIENSSTSVLDIVTKLLDVNRLEENGVSIHWDRIDANDLARQVAAAFKQTLERKKQKLTLSLNPHPAIYRGDWTLSQQILDNLISNASKYSPRGKPIFVSVETLGSRADVIISVTDEGPGISPEDQKDLFKKFARLTARPTAGESSTGLGLAIVHKLVALLKGRITCQSQLGRGTTFRVEFPGSRNF
jgi:signal transduction histidine kinase